jgi:gliding motility-associated-like protein
MKPFYFILSFVLSVLFLNGQTPFTCDGSFYLSLTNSGSSQVYRVTIDPVTNNVQFSSLTNGTGTSINAIGYRITDNFIYGVDPGLGNFYQIDASGSAVLKSALPFVTGSSQVVAGDMTPDGDTMILVHSPNNQDFSLQKVEMSSGNYTYTTLNLTMQSTGGAPTFRTADIAIDPITGDIYGYNGERILKYNRITGLVDDLTFPIQTVEVLGALFFDAFGELHGYGRPAGGSGQNTYFDINKNTGVISLVTTGPNSSGTDGCSCPFTIKMQKTASVDTISPCGRVIFDFKIVNRSGIGRSSIDFQDVMPIDFTFTNVVSNPFGGVVTGIGTNTIFIDDMNIPIGESILRIEAKVSATASGTYFNQAILFNLPSALGSTAVSDYPVTITVDDPTPIVVIPTLQAFAFGDTTVCAGAATASLNASGLNGTGAPYSYHWTSTTGTVINPNAKTPTVIPNGTTTFHVTVTDFEGCTATDAVVVTVDTLNWALGQDTLICIFDSIWLSGAYPALDGMSFLWSNGSTDTTYWAIGTGTFWGTVTDACGNSITDSINVQESFINVLTTTSTDSTKCFAGNDGNASVQITQGTPPYAFQWSNGQNTSTSTNLSMGTYSITVTDANGCKNINTAIVNQPPDIIITSTLIDSASCFGSADGAAFATAIGGVGNYSYAWATLPIQTSQAAVGLLGPASHVVAVSDFYQCVRFDTVFVPAPLPLTLFPYSAGTVCYGFEDATATVTVFGGTPFYSYQWDANAMNQTTMNATNLASGVYVVTVTDYNGCQATAALSIGDALPFIFDYEVVQPSCFGDRDGSLRLTIGNGHPPFSYQWNVTNADTTALNNLASDVYVVTVTDDLGCVQIDSFLLNQPKELVATLKPTDLSCFESQDGQIYIYATGGNPFYEYSINQSAFSNANIIHGLAAGNYEIVVRDTNQCTAIASVELLQPDALWVKVGEVQPINQGDSLLVKTESNLSTDILTFKWEEQFVRNSIRCDTCAETYLAPLADLYYTVMVTDTNGCTAEDGFWVNVNVNRIVAVPNAFTPNDDLVNNVFMIHAEKAITVRMLRIYDRWGELIFEQNDFPVNDPNFGWDGTFKGQVLDTNVFGWLLEVEFLDGVRQSYSGNVTLMK